MRRFSMLLAVGILLVGLGPLPVAAEEEEVEETTAETPWFLELLDPAPAMAKLNETMRTLPRNQWRTARQRMAAEYLDAWKAAGRKPTPDDLPALYSLSMNAQRVDDALALVLPTVQDESLAMAERGKAAGYLASLLRNFRTVEMLGEEKAAEGLAVLEALLPGLEGDETAQTRGNIHAALAARAARQEDVEGQIGHLMLGAEAVPSTAGSAGRTIMRVLQGKAHDFDGYAKIRERADALLPVLRQIAADHLTAVKDAGDDRSVSRAEASAKLLATVDTPLKMLGETAPDWTLEHAYGDVQSLADLQGKVVVLDFWATWCPWCIKSFPAIRDLLRDYVDKDLAVVGVTASASTVYEERYDLDEDLKDKAEPGKRPVAVARLAREGRRKGGTTPSLPDDEYRTIEHETLLKFIENHKMTWPVVMIDKTEPGPKYALTGWPHAVVLDRQGRVRYFKSGALLRERPEAVQAFRAVLDDLLAEADEPAAD